MQYASAVTLLVGLASVVGCWCATRTYVSAEVNQCSCTVSSPDGGAPRDAGTMTACGSPGSSLLNRCSGHHEYRVEMDGGVWTGTETSLAGDLCRCTCASTGETCEVPLACR